MVGEPKAGRSPKKVGRRVALIVYYAIAGWAGIMCALSVTLQIFFSAPPAAASSASCHDGLRSLVTALERARRAAPGVDGDEDRAVDRFRTALDPEWKQRDAVAIACRRAPADEASLDAIERLRYAEEHAVRREAGDLAELRRRVQTIVDEMPAPPNPKRGAAPQEP